MKSVLKITGLLLALMLINYSCSKDDEVPVNLKELEISIDENPTNGQVVGTVQSDKNEGSLTFSITTQTPTGALGINLNTGELTVANATLFDFETNPMITAIVAVDNEGDTKNNKCHYQS